MDPRDDANQASLARLPLEWLAKLAPIRAEKLVRIVFDGDFAWVGWRRGSLDVARFIMPSEGSELFVEHQGVWFRLGSRLPADVSRWSEGDEAIGLEQALHPARIVAQLPGKGLLDAAALRLERSDRPRPASALICSLVDVEPWARLAPESGFEGLFWACGPSEALILQSEEGRLPAIETGTRYHGSQVLAPLGFELAPLVREDVVLEALGAPESSVVIFDFGGYEIVPAEAVSPLSRAAVRQVVKRKTTSS